jgi:hypothetical protein
MFKRRPYLHYSAALSCVDLGFLPRASLPPPLPLPSSLGDSLSSCMRSSRLCIRADVKDRRGGLAAAICRSKTPSYVGVQATEFNRPLSRRWNFRHEGRMDWTVGTLTTGAIGLPIILAFVFRVRLH